MTVCILHCGTATLQGDRHPLTSPCLLQSSQHSLRVLRRVGYSGFESAAQRLSPTGRMGSDSYAREELVAELGAFLLCRRLEVDSCSENHAAYMESWIRVLRETPRVLLKVLSDARKAADLICVG